MRVGAKPDKKDPALDLRTRSAPIIGCVSTPIIEVQGRSHIVSYANPAFCSLLHRSKGELLGKPFADIVPGGDDCLPLLDEAYQTEEGSPLRMGQGEAESDPASWLYATWPPLDPDGQPVGVILRLTKAVTFWRYAAATSEALLISGLHQHELTEAAENLNTQLQSEITERKTAEAALRKANADLKRAHTAIERASKAKDEFLAALSHELRTPLTPVLLAAATLRTDERLPADAREQLGMMERNIVLEARLIDDLLDLTRISHRKLRIRPEPCDTGQLIGFAVEIMRQDARAKEITIEQSLAAKCNGLMVDPARFQQVVWNLLRNAVKFTPRGGRISICTRPQKAARGETWLRLEVADTGIGIEPGQLDQIFLPFDQGGLTGDHRFGGVGLGLAIARAVVDLHGGRITAKSAGANRGATFIVELPGAFAAPSGELGAPAADAAHPAGPGSPSRDGAPKRLSQHLLLVEDNQDTLQILTLLLKHAGHSVVTAATMAAALAAAAHNHFDFVISDLGLPDGTGIELMQALRADYGLRGVALSGYGTEGDMARSRDAGFVAHLHKPIANAELLRVLASLPEPIPAGVAHRPPTLDR